MSCYHNLFLIVSRSLFERDELNVLVSLTEAPITTMMVDGAGSLEDCSAMTGRRTGLIGS